MTLFIALENGDPPSLPHAASFLGFPAGPCHSFHFHCFYCLYSLWAASLPHLCSPASRLLLPTGVTIICHQRSPRTAHLRLIALFA